MLPIVATVSLICVIATTLFLYDRTVKLNSKWKYSLDSIVDQINNNQDLMLDFDKKQLKDINTMEDNISNLAQNITSKNINADSIKGKNISIGENQIFNSVNPESSSSQLYNVGRGGNKSNMNRLQINTPNLADSGFDITTTGLGSRLSIDSKSGDVYIPGKTTFGGGGTIVNSNLTVNGNQRSQGNQTFQSGAAIYGDGRLHVAPNEILYLLPKNGVTIGKEWGGTGSLNAQGDANIGGSLNTNGFINTSNGVRITKNDPGSLIERNYGSNDNRYGIGQFPGGQTRMYTAGGAYVPASVNLSIAKKDGTFVDAINITKDSNLNPTTNINSSLNVNGNQRNNSNQTFGSGAAIYGDGRLHIAPNETLYLLPKNGVTIGKEWGGTGSLNAQGDVNIGGSLNTKGSITSSNGVLITKNDPGSLIERNYGANDNRYGVGQFPGGQTRMYTAGGAYVPASVNLSIAKKDGTFVDAVNVTKDVNLNPTTNINSSLNVNGDTKLSGNTTSGDLYANNIKFSGNFSSFPDGRKDGSEIANDTKNFKQLMLVGNKSGGAERRIGMWDTVNVNGTLNVNGNQRNNGNLTFQNASIINGDGRLHIAPNEKLYLLPKNGVTIGKEWGGTGELNAQGKVSTNSSLCINTSCLTQAQLDAIKKSANIS